MPDANSPITVREQNNILQNFSDATAGRSLQLYYACGSLSPSQEYLLTRDAGISDPASVVGGANIDFDITINKPTIFAGIASIDVKFFNDTPATSNYITFHIIHYDGSTETTIGTGVTKTAGGGSAVSTKVRIAVTRKLFGVGSVLRLNVISSPSGGTFRFYIDPLTAGNELKLWMPIVNLE